jgi:WD40 repeat protein
MVGGENIQQQKKKIGTQQLTGHLGEIYTIKFSPDGRYLASSGHDRLIYFWDIFASD